MENLRQENKMIQLTFLKETSGSWEKIDRKYSFVGNAISKHGVHEVKENINRLETTFKSAKSLL